MPTPCQKADGRYYIDDRIGGRRVRPGLSTKGKDGRKPPVRDEVEAQRQFEQYLEDIRPGLIKTAQKAQEPELGENPRLADVVAYYSGDYLETKGAAPRSFTQANKHLGTLHLFFLAAMRGMLF